MKLISVSVTLLAGVANAQSVCMRAGPVSYCCDKKKLVNSAANCTGKCARSSLQYTHSLIVFTEAVSADSRKSNKFFICYTGLDVLGLRTGCMVPSAAPAPVSSSASTKASSLTHLSKTSTAPSCAATATTVGYTDGFCRYGCDATDYNDIQGLFNNNCVAGTSNIITP